MQQRLKDFQDAGFIPVKLRDYTKFQSRYQTSVTGMRQCVSVGSIPPKDFVIIDVDLKNGEEAHQSLAELQHVYGIKLDTTFTVSTPNKGLHIYMRKPEDGIEYKARHSLKDLRYIEFLTTQCVPMPSSAWRDSTIPVETQEIRKYSVYKGGVPLVDTATLPIDLWNRLNTGILLSTVEAQKTEKTNGEDIAPCSSSSETQYRADMSQLDMSEGRNRGLFFGILQGVKKNIDKDTITRVITEANQNLLEPLGADELHSCLTSGFSYYAKGQDTAEEDNEVFQCLTQIVEPELEAGAGAGAKPRQEEANVKERVTRETIPYDVDNCFANIGKLLAQAVQSCIKIGDIEASKSGEVKGDLSVIATVISQATNFTKLLIHDSSSDRVLWKGGLPPWRVDSDRRKDYSLGSLLVECQFEKSVLSDSDKTEILMLLQKAKVRAGTSVPDRGNLEDVLQSRVPQCSILRDYIATLEWDRTPRIHRIAETYTILPDAEECRRSTYNATFELIFRGLICRTFKEEAVRFECVPILLGKQGIGKSSFLQTLALGDKQFSGTLGDITSPMEVSSHMAGKLIVEDQELNGLNKGTQEQQKSFVTSVSDRYRPLYKSYAVSVKRTAIIFGTSNLIKGQKIRKEDRRFIVMSFTHLDREKLGEDISQLYAEAYHYYKEAHKEQGEVLKDYLYLSLDDTKFSSVLADMRGQQTIHNPRLERLKDWINSSAGEDRLAENGGYFVYSDFLAPFNLSEASMESKHHYEILGLIEKAKYVSRNIKILHLRANIRQNTPFSKRFRLKEQKRFWAEED